MQFVVVLNTVDIYYCKEKTNFKRKIVEGEGTWSDLEAKYTAGPYAGGLDGLKYEPSQ